MGDYPVYRVNMHSSQPAPVHAEQTSEELFAFFFFFFGNWPARITFADNFTLQAAQKNKLLSREGQGKGHVIPLLAITVLGRGVCVRRVTYSYKSTNPSWSFYSICKKSLTFSSYLLLNETLKVFIWLI